MDRNAEKVAVQCTMQLLVMLTEIVFKNHRGLEVATSRA